MYEFYGPKDKVKQGLSPDAARYPQLCQSFRRYSLKISTITVTMTMRTAIKKLAQNTPAHRYFLGPSTEMFPTDLVHHDICALRS